MTAVVEQPPQVVVRALGERGCVIVVHMDQRVGLAVTAADGSEDGRVWLAVDEAADVAAMLTTGTFAQ